MDKKAITCAIEINGQSVEIVTTPLIGQCGFWLWNDQEECSDAVFKGPHFDFSIKPENFKNILLSQKGRPFQIKLDLSDFGSINQFRGYTYSHLGSWSRPILSLSFGLKKTNITTFFTFEGVTDVVNPRTVLGSYTSENMKGYRFKIQFEILNEDLSIYFKDKTALEAIVEYPTSKYSFLKKLFSKLK